MKRWQKIVITGLLISSMFGLSKAYGVDYFTASQDGNSVYVKHIERVHIDVVPGQIKENAVRYALLDLDYALDRVPNHPVALQLMGAVAQLLKKNHLAVERYRKAIEQFPQYALTRAQFGFFLVAIGTVDEGIAMLKQSTEMDAKLAAGHAGLAHAYAKTGNMELAREAVNKARELGFTGQLPTGF